MRSDHEISSDIADAAPVVRLTARSKAAHRRMERRERESSRVVRPVSTISATFRASRLSERTRVVLMVGFSALVHAAMAAIALFAGAGVSAQGPAANREIVTIREVISSSPAAPMSPPSIEPALLEPPSDAVVPLGAPMVRAPLVREPRREKPTDIEGAQPKGRGEGSSVRPGIQSLLSEQEPLLAGDPVDVPFNTNPQPRRRIVGLSYESTTEGSGPAYAVGNTRMGRTGKVAVDKKDVEPAAPGGVPRTPEPVSSGVSSNEVATFVPSAGKLEKPRRLSKVELPYPSLLMARGVEGDVVVRIHILENGTVSKVDVVRGSGHEEFDAAARSAALRERFSPARRKGEPVDYVIEYTYRFRLKQA